MCPDEKQTSQGQFLESLRNPHPSLLAWHHVGDSLQGYGNSFIKDKHWVAWLETLCLLRPWLHLPNSQACRNPLTSRPSLLKRRNCPFRTLQTHLGIKKKERQREKSKKNCSEKVPGQRRKVGVGGIGTHLKKAWGDPRSISLEEAVGAKLCISLNDPSSCNRYMWLSCRIWKGFQSHAGSCLLFAQFTMIEPLVPFIELFSLIKH